MELTQIQERAAHIALDQNKAHSSITATEAELAMMVAHLARELEKLRATVAEIVVGRSA